jgi:hypothetical protein
MRRSGATGVTESLKLDEDLFVDRWRDAITEPDRYYVSSCSQEVADDTRSAPETAFEYSVR